MAGKKREKVREEDATGLRYFDKLAPLLARLHEVGCQRDKAGNRTLHYGQAEDGAENGTSLILTSDSGHPGF